MWHWETFTIYIDFAGARVTVDAKPLPLTLMVLPLKFFISLLYELALISKHRQIGVY